MIGDHHGQAARTATLLLTALDGIFGTHKCSQGPGGVAGMTAAGGCDAWAPRAALLDATSGAQLLIVGSRGRGGLEGMLLGSVSQAMLHHARCPVGVVHPQ